TASGSPVIVQGGNNEVHVTLSDGNNKPVPGQITSAKVIDQQRNRVVYEMKDLKANGSARIPLPPNLDAEPYSQLKLVVTAVGTDGQTNVLQEDFLLTPPTYLTHLNTDKPMYQPGETVRFRSLSLERFSLRPAEERLA